MVLNPIGNNLNFMEKAMKIRTIISVIILLCSTQLVFAEKVNSDSRINSEVRNKISSYPTLKGASINIKTSNGIVYLYGTVDSDSKADTAMRLAKSTQGVKDVNSSHLNVKENQNNVDDSIITAKVKAMFVKEKLFGDKEISAITITVETNNGIVFLGGTAENQQQIDNAIKIAESIEGVKSVKSSIEISN